MSDSLLFNLILLFLKSFMTWAKEKSKKTGGTYGLRSGFCLETQHFSNAPNEFNFPTTILKPGETFTS